MESRTSGQCISWKGSVGVSGAEVVASEDAHLAREAEEGVKQGLKSASGAGDLRERCVQLRKEKRKGSLNQRLGGDGENFRVGVLCMPNSSPQLWQVDDLVGCSDTHSDKGRMRDLDMV